MSTTYFAEVDRDGTVLRVIVADEAFCEELGGDWVETFPDGRARKNYAGRGHTYDAGRDAFIAPKPRADATLDEATARWSADSRREVAAARAAAEGA